MIDDDRETQPTEIISVCGRAVLYRRAMLDEVGLFDEDFFAYMEDVDLAWHAWSAAASTAPLSASRAYSLTAGFSSFGTFGI